MVLLAFGGLCDFVQRGSHAEIACVLLCLWSLVHLDLVDGCIRSKQNRGDSSPLDAASNYFTPTWEMNVAGAMAGRCWLLSDRVQDDMCRRGGRVPRRLSTFF